MEECQRNINRSPWSNTPYPCEWLNKCVGCPRVPASQSYLRRELLVLSVPCSTTVQGNTWAWHGMGHKVIGSSVRDSFEKRLFTGGDLLLDHFCFLLTLVGQNAKRLLEGMAGAQSPLSKINAIISSQQSYLFVFSVSPFLPRLLPAHNFPNLNYFLYSGVAAMRVSPS